MAAYGASVEHRKTKGMGQLTITAPRTDADIRIGRGVWSWLQRNGAPRATYEYDGSHVRVSMPFFGRTDLQLGLDAATAWNIRALQTRPLPGIYDAGVRYAREPMCRSSRGQVGVCEEWLTAHEVIARGQGDCDDLGAWRAAELRLAGDADAHAIARPSAAGWHIVVRHGDGTIEDPSAKLGMPTS
jgi:hypothetical protein